MKAVSRSSTGAASSTSGLTHGVVNMQRATQPGARPMVALIQQDECSMQNKCNKQRQGRDGGRGEDRERRRGVGGRGADPRREKVLELAVTRGCLLASTQYCNTCGRMGVGSYLCGVEYVIWFARESRFECVGGDAAVHHARP